MIIIHTDTDTKTKTNTNLLGDACLELWTASGAARVVRGRASNTHVHS